jgi:hypothetical protein
MAGPESAGQAGAQNLTMEQVKAGATSLEAALADPKLMAKSNWLALVAVRIYLAVVSGHSATCKE